MQCAIVWCIHVSMVGITYMCECVICVLIFLPLCVWLRVTAITDSFVRSKLSNRRFGFVPVMHLIHWGFEDRHIKWSGDPYGFVQWRPDGNSDPKSRHFKWVFALVLFSYLPLLMGICILLASFHLNIWFFLPVWLPVSFHVMSVSTHFICTIDMSVYLRHFIW